MIGTPLSKCVSSPIVGGMRLQAAGIALFAAGPELGFWLLAAFLRG